MVQYVSFTLIVSFMLTSNSKKERYNVILTGSIFIFVSHVFEEGAEVQQCALFVR